MITANEKTIRALVVDDDAPIRKFLKLALPAYGYEVIPAASGSEAVQICSTENPDIIVLDLGLPDLEGTDVISNIREWSKVPIVFFSVKSDESDIMEALDRNADDYVVKPFTIDELARKMQACIEYSRYDKQADPVKKIGKMKVDFANNKVSLDGKPLPIGDKEYNLLKALAVNKGKIVRNRELLRQIGDENISRKDEMQYLRYYISHIRSLIADDAANPKYIMLEPGIGYRLVEPVE